MCYQAKVKQLQEGLHQQADNLLKGLQEIAVKDQLGQNGFWQTIATHYAVNECEQMVLPEAMSNYLQHGCSQHNSFDVQAYLVQKYPQAFFDNDAHTVDRQTPKQPSAQRAATQSQSSLLSDQHVDVGDGLQITQGSEGKSSEINHIGQKCSDGEVAQLEKHLVLTYPQGALLLKYNKAGKTFCYGYYHPNWGVITGGSQAFANKASGLSLLAYIRTTFRTQPTGRLVCFSMLWLLGEADHTP